MFFRRARSERLAGGFTRKGSRPVCVVLRLFLRSTSPRRRFEEQPLPTRRLVAVEAVEIVGNAKERRSGGLPIASDSGRAVRPYPDLGVRGSARFDAKRSMILNQQKKGGAMKWVVVFLLAAILL